MSEDQILKCLIAFIIGFLFSRMTRGDGLSVGGEKVSRCYFDFDKYKNIYKDVKDNDINQNDLRNFILEDPTSSCAKAGNNVTECCNKVDEDEGSYCSVKLSANSSFKEQVEKSCYGDGYGNTKECIDENSGDIVKCLSDEENSLYEYGRGLEIRDLVNRKHCPETSCTYLGSDGYLPFSKTTPQMWDCIRCMGDGYDNPNLRATCRDTDCSNTRFPQGYELWLGMLNHLGI